MTARARRGSSSTAASWPRPARGAATRSTWFGPLLVGGGRATYPGRPGPWRALFPFEGAVDDLRVYDRALAPEEIARLAAGEGGDESRALAGGGGHRG